MADDPLYPLPEIPFLKLRFHLQAQQDCFLPLYKGSLLRGAFGHALRKTVCVMAPGTPCEPCLLRSQCIYTRLFETFIDGAPPRFLRGLQTAPRPYIFEPIDTAEHYAPGQRLTFDFLLLGKSIEMYPYAIYAVSQMAGEGLGRRRHPFALESVFWESPDAEPVANALSRAEPPPDPGTAPPDPAEMVTKKPHWRLLYDGASQRLLEQPQPRTPKRTDPDSAIDPACTLQFLTPTRIKFRDDFSLDFTFRMLVFKMLRRVLELAHFYVPEHRIEWEFHHLLVAADAVQVVSKELTWQDWERRSNRQQTMMKMGGFIGEMTLTGELSPFLNLLHTSEVVHVGKGTVFGNGKVGVVKRISNYKMGKLNGR